MMTTVIEIGCREFLVTEGEQLVPIDEIKKIELAIGPHRAMIVTSTGHIDLYDDAAESLKQFIYLKV